MVLTVLLLLLLPLNDATNFVFMLADDMGWGDTRYNGGTAETPNLDRLSNAKHSVRFNRFYAGGPVCSPTRATFLTGRNHNRDCIYTANTGGGTPDFGKAEAMALPTNSFTLARAAKLKNYTTAHFGKWHLGDFKPLPHGNTKWPVSHPGKQGYQWWYATERSAPSCTVNCGCFPPFQNCITGHYGGTHFPCTNYYYPNASSPFGIHAEDRKEPGDDSLFLIDQFEEWLDQHYQENFMVTIWFHAVHVQFLATQQYRNKYAGRGFSSAQLDYFGDLTAMDVQVGRVWDSLIKYGISNKTWLSFTSDNGPEGDGAPPDGSSTWPGSTNGLRGRKRSLCEGGIRVPGIIHWPETILENRVTEYPAATFDYLPTLMDILRVNSTHPNYPIDGTSLVPFLQNKVSTRTQAMGWEYRINPVQEESNDTSSLTRDTNFIYIADHITDMTEEEKLSYLKKNKADYGHYAVWVEDVWKLYAHIDKQDGIDEGNVFLYNIQTDPKEKTDLAKQHPTRTSDMKAALQKWRESVLDSQKGPNESQCFGTCGLNSKYC